MRMNRFIMLTSVILIAAMISGCSLASVSRPKISGLNGGVYDLFGQPKEGAIVFLGDHNATTLEDGTFSMPTVEVIEGQHEVSVSEDAVELYSGLEEIVAGSPLTLYVNDNNSPIPNPGFELGLDDNGLPFGWTRQGGGDPTINTITLTDEDRFSGSWSVVMEEADDYTTGWGLASELIPVNQGKAYEISTMVKLYGPRVQLYMQYYSSERKLLNADEGAGPRVGVTSTNNEWTTLSIASNGSVPEPATYIRILLYMSPKNLGDPPVPIPVKAYFDHVTFREITD